MIRISLGNIGSGKTVSEVRNMYYTHNDIYSNIVTKFKHQHNLTYNMIIKRIQNGKNEKKSLNIDFWKKVKKPVTVVLDEVHTILNARRSMTKINIIFTDWLSLLRRVLGTATYTGDLVLITQLENRVDIIAREMAHQIRYHICHYQKICRKCSIIWYENSESAEPIVRCHKCGGYNIQKFNHRIEIKHFTSMENFKLWKEMGINTFYKHYIINDIEQFFPMYNTLQWDNLFETID